MRAVSCALLVVCFLSPSAVSATDAEKAQAVAACEYDRLQRGMSRSDGSSMVQTCMKAKGYAVDGFLPRCRPRGFDYFYEHECYTTLEQWLHIHDVIRGCTVGLLEEAKANPETVNHATDECLAKAGFTTPEDGGARPIGYGQD